jgi:hypothetical protein
MGAKRTRQLPLWPVSWGGGAGAYTKFYIYIYIYIEERQHVRTGRGGGAGAYTKFYIYIEERQHVRTGRGGGIYIFPWGTSSMYVVILADKTQLLSRRLHLPASLILCNYLVLLFLYHRTTHPFSFLTNKHMLYIYFHRRPKNKYIYIYIYIVTKFQTHGSLLLFLKHRMTCTCIIYTFNLIFSENNNKIGFWP